MFYKCSTISCSNSHNFANHIFAKLCELEHEMDDCRDQNKQNLTLAEIFSKVSHTYPVYVDMFFL